MFGRLVEITAAAVILLEAAPAYAQSYRPFVVKTPDAVNISAQEWGNPNGKEIVFIHGFMQSHLSWTKQVRDPELARQFRMISYDFRGHGGSDKNSGSEALRQRRSVRGRVECGDPEHVPEEAGARSDGPMARASSATTWIDTVRRSLQASISSVASETETQNISVLLCP